MRRGAQILLCDNPYNKLHFLIIGLIVLFQFGFEWLVLVLPSTCCFSHILLLLLPADFVAPAAAAAAGVPLHTHQVEGRVSGGSGAAGGRCGGCELDG